MTTPEAVDFYALKAAIESLGIDTTDLRSIEADAR